MSCPEWRGIEGLIAEREQAPDADAAAWAPARRHLAACADCRRAAMALEPTLLFAALPEPAVSAGEVAAMQEAVAALVRAGRLEDGLADGGRSRRLARRLRGVAAAAAIAALALVADPGVRRPAVDVAAIDSEELFLPSYPAVLEELDRPDARVYQIPAEGYSVVMIVDASLDV